MNNYIVFINGFMNFFIDNFDIIRVEFKLF